MSSFFLTRVLETIEAGGDRIAFRGHGGELSYTDTGKALRRLHSSLDIEPGEVVAERCGFSYHSLFGENRPGLGRGVRWVLRA